MTSAHLGGRVMGIDPGIEGGLLLSLLLLFSSPDECQFLFLFLLLELLLFGEHIPNN